MNPSDFLQSKWVSSQIQLNKKQSTTGHAESHAILAWMWIVLKIGTAWHLFVILAYYLAVLLHLTSKPRTAGELAQQERIARAQREVDAKKFAEEAMKNLAASADQAHPGEQKVGTS